MGGAAKVTFQKSSRQSGVLFFVLFDDLDAVIITAILAHAMGQFHLMAVGALNDARQCQLPVGAAAVLASLGYFPLRNSHGTYLLFVVKQLPEPGKRIMNTRLLGGSIGVAAGKALTFFPAKESNGQSHNGV